MPLVSIVIPVYKAEDLLPRCLDSILAQTMLDWECVMVDDGSPDGSGAGVRPVRRAGQPV